MGKKITLTTTDGKTVEVDVNEMKLDETTLEKSKHELYVRLNWKNNQQLSISQMLDNIIQEIDKEYKQISEERYSLDDDMRQIFSEGASRDEWEKKHTDVNKRIDIEKDKEDLEQMRNTYKEYLDEYAFLWKKHGWTRETTSPQDDWESKKKDWEQYEKLRTSIKGYPGFIKDQEERRSWKYAKKIATNTIRINLENDTRLLSKSMEEIERRQKTLEIAKDFLSPIRIQLKKQENDTITQILKTSSLNEEKKTRTETVKKKPIVIETLSKIFQDILSTPSKTDTQNSARELLTKLASRELTYEIKTGASWRSEEQKTKLHTTWDTILKNKPTTGLDKERAKFWDFTVRDQKNVDEITKWLKHKANESIRYPDNPDKILSFVIDWCNINKSPTLAEKIKEIEYQQDNGKGSSWCRAWNTKAKDKLAAIIRVYQKSQQKN